MTVLYYIRSSTEVKQHCFHLGLSHRLTRRPWAAGSRCICESGPWASPASPATQQHRGLPAPAEGSARGTRATPRSADHSARRVALTAESANSAWGTALYLKAYKSLLFPGYLRINNCLIKFILKTFMKFKINDELTCFFGSGWSSEPSIFSDILLHDVWERRSEAHRISNLSYYRVRAAWDEHSTVTEWG